MHIVAVSAFLFVLATLFAIFEIEAEGKYGWGEKFPTWYRTRGFAAKVYALFTNKPLTGYHAALFFVPFMILFWPMVATSTVTLHGTVQAFATYFGMVILWDFIWFVLNPHYGLKNFRRASVWWFAREPWLFGRIPQGYIMAWSASLGLAAVSGGLHGGWQDALGTQAEQLGVYLVGLVLMVFFGAPVFRSYYAIMRKSDDREDAGIFHSL